MSRLIEVAEKELGYAEEPANSNNTRYGEWFGLNGVAWCGMFVSWVYAQAGLPLPNIGFKKGFAGCQTAAKYFRDNNLLTTAPAPGDIVLFDWNADGRYDHTGIFVRNIDHIHFETIEGNTSFANNSNGGQVMRRRRKYSQAIFAHVHPGPKG
jgi:cell wall-associated NlpC family hydrolase